jgi:transmembrane sensor
MPGSFLPYETIIKRFAENQLRPDEVPVFFQFLEERPEFREKYGDQIDMDFLHHAFKTWKNDQQSDRLYDRITAIANIQPDQPETITEELHSDEKRFKHSGATLRWAAVFMLGASIFSYFFFHRKISKEVAATTPVVKPMEQILPGSNKAVLLLASGRKIELNDSPGTITDGKLVVDHRKGQLSYEASKVFSINTMTTPIGGQYQLTLADGTKVWLNAASSITYPTAFPGAKREVSITGEAYFEVAKNPLKPFVVLFNKERVEVLGTTFNINCYAEESATRTTLVEGSVKISRGAQELLLHPDEQAVAHEKLVINRSANVSQVLAWKNGTFNFNGQDFAASMRQLERWYEIKVVYDGEVPPEKFGGEIDRNMPLNQALKVLDGIVARFRLEGKVLHVLTMP